MQYEDRISLATPEGVEVEITLAGLGSRMAAGLYDAVAISFLVLAESLVVVLFALALGASEALAGGTAGGFAFFVVIFYGVFYETYREGQTPGKRRLRIRVVGDSGEPVEFRMALVRNLLLVVDVFITMALAAVISIVRSSRSQRLGDMAAGTLVVLSSESSGPAVDLTVSIGALPALERARSWDTSAVSGEEVETIRHFLQRRGTLEPAARRTLAERLAGQVRPKLVGPDGDLADEWLLEILVALKASS